MKKKLPTKQVNGKVEDSRDFKDKNLVTATIDKAKKSQTKFSS